MYQLALSVVKNLRVKKVTVHKCDYPSCCYVSNRVQFLSAHKMNCHERQKSTNRVTMQCDGTSVTTVNSEKFIYRCDYPGCNFIGSKVRSLSMCKTRYHKQRKSLADSSVSKQTQFVTELGQTKQ